MVRQPQTRSDNWSTSKTKDCIDPMLDNSLYNTPTSSSSPRFDGPELCTVQAGNKTWSIPKGKLPLVSEFLDSASRSMHRSGIAFQSISPIISSAAEDVSTTCQESTQHSWRKSHRALDLENLSEKPSSKNRPFTVQACLNDEQGMTRGYQGTFILLQQTWIKYFLKAWIKEIEPHKQRDYPYRGDIRPIWWPEKEKSRFKEPDHLNKIEALWVATYIFRYVIEDQDKSKLKALESRTNKLDLTTKKEQEDGQEAKYRTRCRLLSQLFFNARKHQEFKMGISGPDNITFRFEETPADIDSMIQEAKIRGEKAAERVTGEQPSSSSVRTKSASPPMNGEEASDQEENDRKPRKLNTKGKSKRGAKKIMEKGKDTVDPFLEVIPVTTYQKKRNAVEIYSDDEEISKRVKTGVEHPIDRAEIQDIEVVDETPYFTNQAPQPPASTTVWETVNNSTLIPEPARHRLLPGVMTAYAQTSAPFVPSYPSPGMPHMPSFFTDWPGNIPRSTTFPHSAVYDARAQHSFDASTASFNSLVSISSTNFPAGVGPTSIVPSMVTDLSAWYASSPEDG